MAFLASFSPSGRAPADAPAIRHAFDADAPQHGGVLHVGAYSSLVRALDGPAAGCMILGRVRLDRREELRERMGAGRAAQSDAELVLLAYGLWGEEVAERIHGDYAFAIWDARRQQLFCVRDRIGIRPLCWFERGGVFWIAGSMADLALAPGYHDGPLDRGWVADFLETGFSNDPARAVYSHVNRLPPGHTLRLADSGPTVRRYWALDVAEPLYLRSSGAYLERFHEVLDAAVRDRLADGPVGVSMSGGLDSTTLAAKAVEWTGSAERVIASTTVIGGDRDPEAAMSGLAARYLGIRQDMIEGQDLSFDPHWRDRADLAPEPDWCAVYPEARKATHERLARDAPVWFYGEGPDNALTFEWRAYLGWLAKGRQWKRLAGAAGQYMLAKSPREWVKTVKDKLAPDAPYESGAADFLTVQGTTTPASPVAGPAWRPYAWSSWTGAQWPYFLETHDQMYAGSGVEWRHPFLDLRVLEFMLRSPPIPWGRRKLMLRKAMKGRLPDAILRRDKEALYLDITADHMRRSAPCLPPPGSPVEEFVDVSRLPRDWSDGADPYAVTRVAILDHWLRSRHG